MTEYIVSSKFTLFPCFAGLDGKCKGENAAARIATKAFDLLVSCLEFSRKRQNQRKKPRGAFDVN